MLRLDRSTPKDKEFKLPPEVEAEVSRQVSDVDVDRLPDQPQPRYIVVQQAAPPKKNQGSFWGKAFKAIAGVAVAAAIAATAFFGFGGLNQGGAPVQDLQPGPVAPVEQVVPNDPALPESNTLPNQGGQEEVAPSQLPGVNNSVPGQDSVRDFQPADGQLPNVNPSINP